MLENIYQKSDSTYILQSASLKLLEISWIGCYDFEEFLKTLLLLEKIILVTLLVFCCEFM